MKALVLENGVLHVHSSPMPNPNADQALLRIRMAGICNTDMELSRGYKAFAGILGHEFVAEVVEGSEAWMGKRVVGEINVACNECDLCHRGIPSQCRRRVQVGISGHPGAFAEYLALALRNLYAVPDNVPDRQAVFVEPLAAALQILEAVHLSPRDDVLIVGAGKLGMLCAQVVKLMGANVMAVVRREKQAALLDRWHIPSLSREEVPAQRAQVVIDCTGTAEGFGDALGWVEPRGTIVLKSTYVGIPQANLTQAVVDEIRIIGSRCGPFDAALRLLEMGAVDVESLIEGEYGLEMGVQAFEHAFQPGVLKILLVP